VNRKQKIIKESTSVAKQLGFILEDKEFNYGRGIGRADNFCAIFDWIIIFELEFSQRHPEMNVLKIWPYLNKFNDKKIFLIHHITDTKKVSPNRIKLSKFIASKIKDDHMSRFEYFQIQNAFDKSEIIKLKKKLKELAIT
jgi:hypothetical protein